MNEGHNSGHQRLRSIVERLARLEEEKRAIAEDIKEVLGEAASAGFEKAAVRQMVKEHLDPKERKKRIALAAMYELYSASLGNLDGTPLGDAARKQWDDPDQTDEAEAPAEGEADAAPAAPRGEMTQEEIEAARERGSTDHAAGKKIIYNPYVSGDPRRAAWDEGYCAAAGSDGMDIPEALKRKRKPKKKAGEADDGEES